MVTIKNVTKNFGTFCALDHLSMTIPKGSIYGLVGPNGSGKSTIIRHIIGAYRPDEGEVLLDGQPVYENPAAKLRMASISDDFFYFPSANTRDMMKFYKGMFPTFSEQRYEALRQAFPEIKETAPIRRLSKGMQKQVAFWLAISCMPEFLVLDEPIDGLDPVMRRQVWSILMGDVAARQTTVLISSHNLRELEDVCDHVGVLSHGKVLLERSLSDLQENIVKVQLAFSGQEIPNFETLKGELNILHHSQLGRVHTLIIRGKSEEIYQHLSQKEPIMVELLPLNLEEIFIYELGGEEYAIHEILL